MVFEITSLEDMASRYQISLVFLPFFFYGFSKKSKSKVFYLDDIVYKDLKKVYFQILVQLHAKIWMHELESDH